jgi:hypothetical protein
MFGWKKDEVKAVVDVDIMDEAAGKARLTMAAASKERRQLEAKAQAERAASQKKINQNAGQLTQTIHHTVPVLTVELTAPQRWQRI